MVIAKLEPAVRDGDVELVIVLHSDDERSGARVVRANLGEPHAGSCDPDGLHVGRIGTSRRERLDNRLLNHLLERCRRSARIGHSPREYGHLRHDLRGSPPSHADEREVMAVLLGPERRERFVTTAYLSLCVDRTGACVALSDAWVDRSWWHVVADPSVDRG